jgi:uncharacterized protein (DUF488 family)
MTMTREILTIGAYGFNAETFFEALTEAGVDTLVDVRRRRGVRGHDYAWANHQRLELRLDESGIRYLHRPELSPSLETRQRQYAVDAETHTAKRQRTELSPEFKLAYHEECLTGFDPNAFLADLPSDAKRIALFCVEREPGACHRSLLADVLSHTSDVTVRHLIPIHSE